MPQNILNLKNQKVTLYTSTNVFMFDVTATKLLEQRN